MRAERTIELLPYHEETGMPRDSRYVLAFAAVALAGCASSRGTSTASPAPSASASSSSTASATSAADTVPKCGAIVGVLRDQFSQKLVEGAEVRLQFTATGAFTKRDGKFALKPVTKT